MSRWNRVELPVSQPKPRRFMALPSVKTMLQACFGMPNNERVAQDIQTFVPFADTSHASVEFQPFDAKVAAICERYVQLRLQPYLSTLQWEMSQRGMPALRPLLHHFPDDPATYTIPDQMMVGAWLLAAPIYEPKHTCRTVYLPQGQWYDWWNETLIEGPTTLLVQGSTEQMPLFVRAGAIIPNTSMRAYVPGCVLDPLILDVFPGVGGLTLYEGDQAAMMGDSDQFCITTFRQRVCDGRLCVVFGEQSGLYAPPHRILVLRVHNLDRIAAAAYPTARYDAKRRVLTLELIDDGRSRQLEFAFKV
jgi:hypothetical protein